MKNFQFEKISRIEAPLEKVFQWHERPGAIERYSPPWDPISVIRKTGGIEAGAEVVLLMHAGPVPYRWHARHTDFIPDQLFRDEMVKGPFKSWVHTHEFEAVDQNSCQIRDHIEFQLPFHPLRKQLSSKWVQQSLERIFYYRHEVLKQDLSLQLPFSTQKPLKILVSGSSGLIGSALIPLLTTAGHEVLRLVRRKPVSQGEVFWDPIKGELDPSELIGVDVVINLAGEKIGDARWTPAKKREIIDSRILGTRLLVTKMTQMDQPPQTFLNASAIGYYGDRGDEQLTEGSSAGEDFISIVCRQWEQESLIAQEKGIRTANLRIGIVLDPRGGALNELLPMYRLKMGTMPALGDQFVSWLGLNDVADMVFHIMHRSDISGAVNLVAPTAVRNQELSQLLAELHSSFGVIKVPASLLKLRFGEMAEELVLSSTRVKPEILTKTGFNFRYPELNGLLKHILGKEI